MPKELTHIVIAGNVCEVLQESPSPLGDIVGKNKAAFYLGAIIPDAFFYNLLPRPPVLKEMSTITAALHRKPPQKNDAAAESLLIRATEGSYHEQIEAAFSAGIVTHTVSDRVIHQVIDHYRKKWGESGLKALGTHRQIETLFDMVLLTALGKSPRNVSIQEAISLSSAHMDRVLRFAVNHLVSPPSVWYHASVKATRWAHTQQLALLRLFGKESAYRAARLARRITSGKSECISGLFYPRHVSLEAFPILKNLSVKKLSNGKDFKGDLYALTRHIVNESIKCLQHGSTAVLRSAINRGDERPG